MTTSEFISSTLLLDIETTKAGKIEAIGAVLDNETLSIPRCTHLRAALQALDELAKSAICVLGHNLLGHDLPVLRAQSPRLALHSLPVLDTLYLSPLAFPENPYHRLVKDYKLVRDSINDPLADARLAATLFGDQWKEFEHCHADTPDLIRFYRAMLEGAKFGPCDGRGFGCAFEAMGVQKCDERETATTFLRHALPHACCSAAERLSTVSASFPEDRPSLAYVLAWLRVSGHNSVLPPWVRRQFPRTVEFLKQLRDEPCDDSTCAYCRATHDPRAQLTRFFRFPNFQSTPAARDGGSLQEAIVRHGLRDQPLLAILPTGAGKSLCYQLPALVRNFRRGVLTIVISPLQALMKDQVDGLTRRVEAEIGDALSGLLTAPERGQALERIRLGDTAILYVSPEQLRNRSFAQAISHREIGCWVFDEAHCLSKWGHDFRPDYLYAARFIREFSQKHGVPVPPVACFTATAKQDVKNEILAHFRDALGQELAIFEASAERDNLQFEVQTVTRAEKWGRVHEILSSRLPSAALGCALVYAATRSGTEQAADFLRKKGWKVEAFHAGLNPPEKRRIQDAFLRGETQVICATNAFGMGIDKDNVRLVIHLDIPGSIENYLQEAGRAGRDRAPADCILLYDKEDIETQFQIGAFSKLSQRDIAEILRGLRRASSRREGEVVLTAGEILRDEETQTSFESTERGADVKVRTAIAVLERTGYIERNENRTRVFQGRPLVLSMEEAKAKIDPLNLSPRARDQWLAVLGQLMNAPPDEGMSADGLAELPEFRSVAREAKAAYSAGESDTGRVLRVLNDMADAGLIKKDFRMTAFVRHQVVNASRHTFDQVCALDRAMLSVLRDEAPDPEGWLTLSLPRLNQRLKDDGHECAPELVRRLLTSLSMDGKGLAGRQGSIEMKYVTHGCYRVKLQRTWDDLVALAEKRRAVAGLALGVLLGKIPPHTTPSASVLVEFSTEDILRAMRDDLVLRGQITDPQAAMERALMFLHEQNVIILHHGLAVFRQAMTIKVLPERKERFSRGDYKPLEEHYQERIFQVHVIDEYARLALEKIQQALALVVAYFSMDKQEFVQRYFEGRREMIERATSAESHQRIVESLRHPVQMAITAAHAEDNMLILAGPGSGKTRVVAHRCAWLLRVQRVPARSILVLCFNRNAAITLRRRITDLAGPDARGVTVQTYHNLAMRLVGASFAERLERGADSPDFDKLITDATRLLRGESTLPGLEPDELRERLLAGFQFILVDEYQDIDQDQYDLISAIAGRTADSDQKLAILAVGDDDQNIYTFRGANVVFIRRFQQDYGAKTHHLLENYRSMANIIAASQQLIAHNRDRMKSDQLLRVNKSRTHEPPGGVWECVDPVSRGRVQVLRVRDEANQAVAMVEEMKRLRTLHGATAWSSFAVLARTRDELAPIRSLCEAEGIPVAWPIERGNGFPLHRVRESAHWLEFLAQHRGEHLHCHTLEREMDRMARGDEANPWWQFLREILVDWREETGDAELPVVLALEFFHEAMAERRREHVLGHGVWLSTAHAAKGTEFDHVLIAGGGWANVTEEDRRVYYVAMTRARHTLTLCERADTPNPHSSSLHGKFLVRRTPETRMPAAAFCLSLRYSLLGLSDIFLDFAGQRRASDPIHARLALLRSGSSLTAKVQGERIMLFDEQGEAVSRLSQDACEEWNARLSDVRQIRVIAMVRRCAEDSQDEFSERTRCAQWEVPIVEVVSSPPAGCPS